MLLAWTTVSTLADAERLAGDVVRRNLAVCVQIEAPIQSFYRWDGKEQREQEYRLCFKLLWDQQEKLESYVREHHPYEVPEWVVVVAEHVGEKYLSWARTNSSNPPL